MKVKFEFPHRAVNKTKTKNLIGKHKNLGKWHFAVSAKPILTPTVAFSLKNHIAFTDDGLAIWTKQKEIIKDGVKVVEKEVDKARIHTHRRAKGKRLFNEEWRDLLIGFLHSLKRDNKIQIQLSSDFTLTMPTFTESYWSDFGYFDPHDKSRQGLLSMYEFGEDEDEAIVDKDDQVNDNVEVNHDDKR
jgi:hypothetical protein